MLIKDSETNETYITTPEYDIMGDFIAMLWIVLLHPILALAITYLTV